MEHRIDWDQYFMMQAALLASRSTCQRLSVGAVLGGGGPPGGLGVVGPPFWALRGGGGGWGPWPGIWGLKTRGGLFFGGGGGGASM